MGHTNGQGGIGKRDSDAISTLFLWVFTLQGKNPEYPANATVTNAHRFS